MGKFVECDMCEGTGQTIEARMYPSGHTEVMVDCEDCSGNGEIELDE